jgi:hypothetical protein
MSEDFRLGAIKPIKRVGIQPGNKKIIKETPGIQLDPNKHDLACPTCGEILDGAGGYSFGDKEDTVEDGQHRHRDDERESKPAPGCPSICCKCGEYLMYDGTEERLIIRAMSEEEWEEIKRDAPEAASFLALARRAFTSKNLPPNPFPFWEQS